MRLLVAIALTAASSAVLAGPSAGTPPVPPPATIQVTGQAQVSESPDRVYIDIGVTTQARKAEDAASENATSLSAVIAAVKQAAGAAAQLTTTEYSIGPNYSYPRNGGTPTVVGYSVSNVIQARLDDLHKVGNVIDAATRAGSNNVQGIRFALRNEQAPRSEALKEAAIKARQDADALAGALGLRIVRVLSVEEQGAGPRPVPMYSPAVKMALARAPATSIEQGMLDVSASVTLTVEVAPAKR
ncbi:MAG TPA: SIMPL domain-containing protein [Steroidobacteraceae bacterium]|nr:SIMPL domain-containing protein [Steroidobacteraceae bacterium]